MLQETLTKNAPPPKLPGYILYHKARQINSSTVDRGLITAVRADVPHVPIPKYTTNKDWESLTITVQGFKNTTLDLINTYVSPKHLFDLDQATAGSENFLLAGDLNANSDVWGSSNTIPGQHLLDQLNRSESIIINDPKVPTTVYGSTLDLVIVSPQLFSATHWHQNESLTSDHIANSIDIASVFHKAPGIHIPPRWITEKADWDLFAKKLRNCPDPDTNPSLDRRLQSLLHDVYSAATEAIPISRAKATQSTRSFLPPEAKKWTKQVSQLTKIFKANPTERNREKLRLCQQATKRQLFDLKKQQWDKWCNQLAEMSTTQIWRQIKKIKGHAPTATTVNPKVEANRLADHFTTRADQTTLPKSIITALKEQLPLRQAKLAAAKQKNPDTNTLFTFHELDNVLRRHRTTAPGEDGFTYTFYAKAPRLFKNRILNLFNQSWIEGKLPEQWKTAIVIPIAKPGGKGHRPISLLSTLSKIMERMILARLQWKLPKTKNIFGFVKDRATIDAIVHLATKITARKGPKRRKAVFVAFMDLDKAFERVDHLSMLDSLISLGISGRIITWIENFLTNRKLKVKIQGTISDPHDLTTGCPQGSTISPTIFNALVAQLLTVTLPISVDILVYADDLVLISHGSKSAEKLQKALNAVDKAANNLGLYFSPAKTKTMAFNTTRQPKFILGLQHLEMVNDYRYLGVTIDRRLSFIQHVAVTKRKVNSRFNMIKAITNLKIGVNTKMLITLYKSLIQSVILYAAPVLLLACSTALQNLERTQRVPLRYILGLPNETNSIMLYRESGILPLRLLIKKETATYLLRTATKPFHTDMIQRVQEETQKDPRVFNDASWSIKAAWLQKEIGIPPVIPPTSKECAPWLEPPIQVIIQNPIQKKVDPEGAAIEATKRIACLNESRTSTINIYTDASSQDNGTTAWACFIKEKDEELRGRIPNHTPITLAELHAIKAALIWISRRTIHERVIIHSDSMGALTIITTANFHTYPEIITEIYTTASALKQRGIQVILHWVPSHINLEGNDRADKLANEATSLDVIEYAEHTPGTFNYLVDRFISNRLESIYTDYTSASKDWYQKTTVVGHNILNNRLVDTQLRRLRFWVYTRNFTGPSPETLCRHCQQVYDPVHYLLNCPAYPKHRRSLKGHLRPEDHKLPDRHLAALLIRKSTFLPDIITPLLQKDPYTYQGQIRPPLWTSG